MIIHDLKEFVRRKEEAKVASSTDEYRQVLMAAVHTEIERLQHSIDALTQAHKTTKANNQKRLLMTIFALLEQIPWLGLDQENKGNSIEQRAKDTILDEKATDGA